MSKTKEGLVAWLNETRQTAFVHKGLSESGQYQLLECAHCNNKDRYKINGLSEGDVICHNCKMPFSFVRKVTFVTFPTFLEGEYQTGETVEKAE